MNPHETFNNYPFSKTGRTRNRKSDIAILGVPWDRGNTVAAGAAYGPTAVRRSSYLRGLQYSVVHEVFYPHEIDVVDVGDLLEGLDLKARAMHVLNNTHLLCSIGGDHSISNPLIQATYEHLGEQVAVAHFDAHADVWDEVGGRKDTHASPFMRLAEAGAMQRLFSFGLRGNGPNPSFSESVAKMLKYNYITYGMHNLETNAKRTRAVKEFLEVGVINAPVYVSIDVDVLDPAFAPGTSTPEPGGLSTAELLLMLRPLFLSRHLIGVDIVETNPTQETMPSRTADVVKRIVMELIACREALETV